MGQMPKQRRVRREMIGEARQTCLAWVHVREGSHRGGRTSGAVEEQRELIDEIAQGGFGRQYALVGLSRERLFRDAEFVAEKVHLIVFGLEVVVSLICEDEIQQKKTRPDELGRVAPAIAKIFTVDLAVERLRKEMINAAHILILAPCCVASAFEFLRKLSATACPSLLRCTR